MAKISQLAATTSPADTDSLPIENTSGTITTKRITISSLASTIANKVRSLLSIGSASSLKTSSKEIVGAVNEVHDAVDTYATNTERLLTDHQQQLNWCSDGIIDLQDSVNSLNTNKSEYIFITLSDSDTNYRFAAPTTEKSLALPSIVGCKVLFIKIGLMTTGETSPRAGYVEYTMEFSDYSERHEDTQGFTIYAGSSWNCFGGVNVNFSTGQIKFAFQGCTGWDPTQFLIKRVYGLK